MRKGKRIAACVALALLAGCASAPPTGPGGRELTSDDYGPVPHADTVIREFLRGQLKDPASAQLEFVAMRATWVKGSVLSGAPDYGWGICYRVNAKNSFGGYTGFRNVGLLWRDGRVRKSYGTGAPNMFDDAMAKSMCDHLAGR